MFVNRWNHVVTAYVCLRIYTVFFKSKLSDVSKITKIVIKVTPVEH